LSQPSPVQAQSRLDRHQNWSGITPPHHTNSTNSIKLELYKIYQIGMKYKCIKDKPLNLNLILNLNLNQTKFNWAETQLKLNLVNSAVNYLNTNLQLNTFRSCLFPYLSYYFVLRFWQTMRLDVLIKNSVLPTTF